MNRGAELLLFLLFIYCTVSESQSETTITTRQSSSSPKKLVSVNKCCRIGDKLVVDENDRVRCDVGTGSSNWAPRVFLPKKNAFYEKAGQLPPFFSVNEEERPNCSNPERYSSQLLAVIGNGSLFLTHKHVTIGSSESFCVDQDFSLVCRSDKEVVPENMTIYQLTKCCAPNEIMTSSSCVALNASDPLLNRKLVDKADVNFDIDYKFPDCGGSSNSNEFAIAGTFLSSNYDITTGIIKTESNKVFERNQYCLDHVIAAENHYEGVKIFTCSEHYGTAPPLTIQQVDDVRFAIYSIGLLISVLFLIATLAVGFLLLSNHHMLHWRCQTNYVICLLIGDLLLAITQLSGSNLHGPSCIIVAHLMHFFFLSAFFWLNAMCFNIWWTFR